MAAIKLKIYYVLLKVIYGCECNMLKTVSPMDLKLDNCFHIIYRTDAIDFWPSAKNKMTDIQILKRMFCLSMDILISCHKDKGINIGLIS